MENYFFKTDNIYILEKYHYLHASSKKQNQFYLLEGINLLVHILTECAGFLINYSSNIEVLSTENNISVNMNLHSFNQLLIYHVVLKLIIYNFFHIILFYLSSFCNNFIQQLHNSSHSYKSSVRLKMAPQTATLVLCNYSGAPPVMCALSAFLSLRQQLRRNCQTVEMQRACCRASGTKAVYRLQLGVQHNHPRTAHSKTERAGVKHLHFQLAFGFPGQETTGSASKQEHMQ